MLLFPNNYKKNYKKRFIKKNFVTRVLWTKQICVIAIWHSSTSLTSHKLPTLSLSLSLSPCELFSFLNDLSNFPTPNPLSDIVSFLYLSHNVYFLLFHFLFLRNNPSLQNIKNKNKNKNKRLERYIGYKLIKN